MFTKINKLPRQFEYLTEDIDTEVIIIGGGITGSILGYYFSKANIPTVILEKSRIAYGSTSITTALLHYELDSTAKDLIKYTTLSNVVKSYELGLKALDEIDKFISEYGNKCNYERKDTLFYSSKEKEIDIMKDEYLLRKDSGFEVEFITKENNPFSFDIKGGVYSKNGGGQLDPYKYTHHLLDVSCNNGLRIYENTEVMDINYLPEGVEVITSYGYKVKGKKVIIATGYNTGKFTKMDFGHKTITYSIATKPVSSFDGWHNKALIRDNCKPYSYFRTSDNRILAGGEDMNLSDDGLNEKLAEEKYSKMEQKLNNMFPKIKDIKVDYKYCGVFASTKDELGFIGEDPKNKDLWYCLGYGANGILSAIFGGMILSKLYKGEEDEYLHLFKVNRF
jgi:glycine/D-amino acid oxidase-like deaminating enzyme